MRYDKLSGRAKLLMIHIDENDWWEGEALYEAIVKKLRMLDLVGATVYRGILGYGAKNRLHKSGFLGLSEDLPVTISVIDTEGKIRRALPVLREMISEGLVAMTDVEVLHHISGKWEGKK
jgi:PII-like signaling protein